MFKNVAPRARYAGAWDEPFQDRVRQALRPGASVLDIGSGRRPAVPPADRPAGCRYVGLDVSASELDRAPPHSYDETWVGDAASRVPELVGRFDLVVSFQVLEHVRPLDATIENCRAYLRPGGRFVTQLSGAFSLFGLVNRVIPHRLALWILSTFLGWSRENIFPAHYHQCWYSALERILRPWTRSEILPRYTGGMYFSFSPALQRLYLIYEDWAMKTDRRNLATHYLIDAVK